MIAASSPAAAVRARRCLGYAESEVWYRWWSKKGWKGMWAGERRRDYCKCIPSEESSVQI